MTHLTPRQNRFIESVLRLQPQTATFDCDGTLWSETLAKDFFSWNWPCHRKKGWCRKKSRNGPAPAMATTKPAK